MGIIDARHIGNANVSANIGHQQHETSVSIFDNGPLQKWVKDKNESLTQSLSWNQNDRLELRFDFASRTCKVFLNDEEKGTMTDNLPDEMYLAVTPYWSNISLCTTLFECS